MRKLLLGLSLFLFIAVLPQSVFACTFEVYCPNDGDCVRSGGALYNVCLEKTDSGEKSDKKVQKVAANKEKSTIAMLREYIEKKKRSKSYE